VSRLIRFSFQHEHYSHIILVPLISSALAFVARRRIFAVVQTDWWAGLGVIATGALFYVVEQRPSTSSASPNDRLSAAIFAVVVVWIGIFVFCYGIRAFRRGLFPLLFLFLMVPLPDALLDRVIAWLLMGSAEVTYALLKFLGVPVVRAGYVFSFPGFAIEIAQECSGIRSSLALLVMSLLAGHVFLRSAWAKAILIAASLPIAVIKNGIRIVTLSLLAAYVDPRFLTGSLHRHGGFVFFLVAMMLLMLVLRVMQKLEAKSQTTVSGAPG